MFLLALLGGVTTSSSSSIGRAVATAARGASNPPITGSYPDLKTKLPLLFADAQTVAIVAIALPMDSRSLSCLFSVAYIYCRLDSASASICCHIDSTSAPIYYCLNSASSCCWIKCILYILKNVSLSLAALVL